MLLVVVYCSSNDGALGGITTTNEYVMESSPNKLLAEQV